MVNLQVASGVHILNEFTVLIS